MKNIIAAAILGLFIILAAIIHGGIYTTTHFGSFPVALNKLTGNLKIPGNAEKIITTKNP